MKKSSLCLAIGIFFGSLGASAQVSNDLLIVPGRSLGKIFLGMPRQSVLTLLKNPNRQEANYWEYLSKSNSLKVYFENGVVEQIEFTSPNFKTEDGFATSNCFDNSSKGAFIQGKTESPCIRMKEQLKGGGLTFINVSIGGQSPGAVQTVGIVYAGNQPKYLPIQIGNPVRLQPAGAVPFQNDLSTLRSINDPSDFLDSPKLNKVLKVMMGKQYESFLDCAQMREGWDVDGDNRFVSAYLNHDRTDRECFVSANLKSGHCVAGYLNGRDLNVYGASNADELPGAVKDWLKDLKERCGPNSEAIHLHFHQVAASTAGASAASLIGHYERAGNNRWEKASLDISSIRGNKVEFSMDAVNGANMGGAGGIAVLAGNVATYKDTDNSASIRFEMSGRTIKVHADPPEHFGGMGVYLDGTYNKARK